MASVWRIDVLGAAARRARALVAVATVAVGVGGCADMAGFTEILENLNRTLTSIAVLKKGGD